MYYLSAHNVYKKGAFKLILDAYNKGFVSIEDTVWQGGDGSYAIGDDYDPATFEDDCEMSDRGSVGEWLEELG